MPTTDPDRHPELHAILAVWYQDLARYHLQKALSPTAEIPIPQKPKPPCPEPPTNKTS